MASARGLLAVLSALAGADAALGATESQPDFLHFVEEAVESQPDVVRFVDYYSVSCPHCQILEPVWAEAEVQWMSWYGHDPAPVMWIKKECYAANWTEGRDYAECVKNNITGFPTLRLYPGNGAAPTDYPSTKERTTKLLMAFVHKTINKALASAGQPSEPTMEAGYPQYVVNLDEPAKTRWRHIYMDYRSEPNKTGLPEYVDHYYHILENRFYTLFPSEPEEKMDEWADIAAKTAGPEFLGEMESVVEVLNHPNVTMRRVLLLFMMYELGSPLACSNLLAAKPDGSVIHGRNLDWKPVTPLIEVNFTRNGKLLYQAPVFLLGVLHTVLRVGRLTFTQDTRRYTGETLTEYMERNLEALKAGGKLQATEVRRLVEQEDIDFATAVQQMAATDYAAPSYFILSGPGAYEGAVIEIDRMGGHSRPWLNVQSLMPQIGRWYLVQTNDDLEDAPKDTRRPLEHQELVLATQDKVSESFVMDAMTTSPLLVDLTIFSWVGNVREGTHQLVVGPSNAAPMQDAAAAAAKAAAIKVAAAKAAEAEAKAEEEAMEAKVAEDFAKGAAEAALEAAKAAADKVAEAEAARAEADAAEETAAEATKIREDAMGAAAAEAIRARTEADQAAKAQASAAKAEAAVAAAKEGTAEAAAAPAARSTAMFSAAGRRTMQLMADGSSGSAAAEEGEIIE